MESKVFPEMDLNLEEKRIEDEEEEDGGRKTMMRNSNHHHHHLFEPERKKDLTNEDHGDKNAAMLAGGPFHQLTTDIIHTSTEQHSRGLLNEIEIYTENSARVGPLPVPSPSTSPNTNTFTDQIPNDIDDVIQNIGEKIDEVGKQAQSASIPSSSSKKPVVFPSSAAPSSPSSSSSFVQPSREDLNSKANSGNIPFVKSGSTKIEEVKESSGTSTTMGNFFSKTEGGTAPSTSTAPAKKSNEKDGFLVSSSSSPTQGKPTSGGFLPESNMDVKEEDMDKYENVAGLWTRKKQQYRKTAKKIRRSLKRGSQRTTESVSISKEKEIET